MEPVPPDRKLDTRERRKGARMVLIAAIVALVLLAGFVGLHVYAD